MIVDNYLFTILFQTEEDHVKMIEDAMKEIANKSCIKFRPRKKSEEHSLMIQVRILLYWINKTSPV